MIFLILLFSDQTLRLFSSYLTTCDKRSKRLFPNFNWTNRSHYAADYMLLLHDWRRGFQRSIEAVFAFRPCPIVWPIYVAPICLFLHGWFGWVLGGESVMSIPGIQACSVFRHDVAPVCGQIHQRVGFCLNRPLYPTVYQGKSRYVDPSDSEILG